MQGAGELNIVGEVVDSGTPIVIDSCAPDASCSPMLNELLVDAPAGFTDLVPGLFVEVRAFAHFEFGGCVTALVIRNVDSFGGVPNPWESGQELWLAGAEGTLVTLDIAPFAVEAVPLGCYPDQEEGCSVKDDFELRFFDRDLPDNDVVVHMGESEYAWPLEAGASFSPRNLRSYESGLCDDYWNWAYYLDRTPVF
jgi:hypothetical protein